MRTWRRWVGAVVVSLPALAGGQTFVLQSNPVAGPGMLGNAGEMSAYEEAMGFTTLSSSFQATEARIWTTFQNGNQPLYDYGFRGVFAWAVYDDQGGLPGSVVASGAATPTRLSHEIFSPGFDRSEWSIPLPGVSLSGNTAYWLGLVNTDETGSYASTNFFYWAAGYVDPSTAPNSVNRTDGHDWSFNNETDADYFAYGNRLTLAVYGTTTTTPEPSSLALLGTGLVGLVPALRRRK